MNKKRLAWIAGIVVIIIIVAGAWYCMAHRSAGNAANNQGGASNTSSTPLAIADFATSTNAYGLFTSSTTDLGENTDSDEYFDDGIISSGAYAGYHRVIVATQRNQGMGAEIDFVFATKDYQTFTLDTNTDSEAVSDRTLYFNTSKVIGVGPIPFNQPDTIDEGNFTLVRYDIGIGPLATGSVQIASNIPGLFFFNSPYPKSDLSIYKDDAGYLQVVTAENDYVSGSTDVVIEDQYGLLFDYLLIPKESVNTLQGYSDSAGMWYSNWDLNQATNTYDSYGQLLPGGCGGVISSDILQNITDNDLVKVATTQRGIDMYTLKDANSPLDKAMYYDKITSVANEDYSDINNTSTVPTYAEYVSKNPILIFKDPWGRWVGLGEFDYHVEGGCGKPVIYLYPTVPTDITVQFVNAMKFDVAIPSYVNEWHVLAQPNGQLIDLQPSLTNCTSINTNVFGSEYAKTACDNNDYPYLYWAGNTQGKYPVANGGWIIAKKDVASFLDTTLTEVGFNENEKSDMTSYWVPTLLKKDAPYYRISFFQTQQMNQFIPMNVSPAPDTAFRLFLDWSPLASAPSVLPQPQVLDHLTRKGFTLVEWGGLKQ